jgi:predicted DsbA family dithiol-disulfide isomerase
MTVERAIALQDQLAATAAGDGLDMRFDRTRDGSTFDAHRVVHLAAGHGLQDAMKERLLRAHFTDGELVADPEVLARLAAEVGVPDGEVRELLAGDRFADAVRDDERAAASLGIQAVPFFVVDRAMGAAGAQPPEVLGDLLRRGWEARSPLAMVADGDACGPDGC